jgi:DNA replication protein DnaD
MSHIDLDRIPKELLGKWGGPALAKGWTNIPNTLLEQQSNLDLTNSEMMLLIHIISFSHKAESPAFPSITTLATLLNQHPRTVQRTIGRLVKKGIIHKIIRSKHANDLGMTNIYNLDPLKKKLSRIKP